MAEELNTGPEGVPLTVYQNDDSDVEWFPFGEDVAEVPEDFADYGYFIDVWQGLNSGTKLLTSEGGSPQIETDRDDETGMITFRFPRETMLAFSIIEDMRYDVREVDPDGKDLTIYAGVFAVTVRGSITGT